MRKIIPHRYGWFDAYRIAGSWILSRSLTNKYLTSQGYDDISERYEVMRLSYRTVRTVVYKNGCSNNGQPPT